MESKNQFKPLMIFHGYGLYSYFTPYPIAMKRLRKKLESYEQMGYGGIVTNVFYGKKIKYRHHLYLKSKRCFKFTRGLIELCKEMNFRVWIYDECGYPSGSALGQVIKSDPETEAYGIICTHKKLKDGETAAFELPYGHEKVKAVLFEDENGTIQNITQLANNEGSISYTADCKGTVYYIASKVLFEGVHPSRKFSTLCRYIDVMDKKAVKDFLVITHYQYKKYLGDYFGNVIEAFFTDEPSVNNQYFSELNNRLKPIDKPDKNFPFYKFVVWSRGYEDEFLKRKGYDIIPHIPELFKDTGAEYSKVKQDYFEVCAELYKEAYFDAIYDFCEENNLKSSGHLLGEEALSFHCLNEFDYFKMFEGMHYPGIDILTCEPEKLLRNPLTLKIASSATKFKGNNAQVMSESSFHFDDKTKISKEKILCSLLIQYSKGITVITSYLSTIYLSEDNYHWIFSRLSKVGEAFNNLSFVTPLLIYYPIKSMYGYFTPTLSEHNKMDYNPTFKEISNSFNRNLLSFQNNQIEYDIIDNKNLSDLFDDDKKVAISNYKAVYIPMCNFEVEDIKANLLRIAESGVAVYIQNSEFVTEDIKNCRSFSLVNNADDAASLIFENGHNDILLQGENSEKVAYCHKCNFNEELYMFVNPLANEINFNAVFKEKTKPSFYSITEDCNIEFYYIVNGEKTTTKIVLEPYGACFVRFKV